MKRKQLVVFLVMLVVYALSTIITYTFFIDELLAVGGMTTPEMELPPVVYVLINAGIVLIIYGLLGFGGYWFAKKLGMPGIFREDGDFRSGFLIPLGLGVVWGVFLILGDILFAPFNGFGKILHPGFPASILASLSAGIGEEIAFRGFVFGLWAFLLDWLLKRFNQRTLALWIANVIAALAFGAGHLTLILILTGAASVAELSPFALIEVFLLNGLVGLVAGNRYMKDGLIAASGVHFWTDVVFHVIWGLVA